MDGKSLLRSCVSADKKRKRKRKQIEKRNKKKKAKGEKKGTLGN